MKQKIRIPALALRIVCVLLLLASLLFTWITMANVSANLLDADASSHLVYANTLAEKFQLFLSPDWAYSTELNFPGQEIVFTPLFMLFHNWTMVRIAGTIILHLLLLAAYAFMARQAGMSINSWCVTSAAMMMPFSVAYGRIVLYHTYYAVTLIHAFLIVGLYLAVINRKKTKHRVLRMVCSGGALLVVSLMAGLPSVRLLMVVTFPLAVTSVLLALLRERGQSESPWTLLVRHGWEIGWAFAALIASVVGYLINTLVLMRFFTVADYSAMNLDLLSSNAFFTSMYQIFRALLTDLGVEFGVPLFSITGLVSVAVLGVLFLLLILPFRIICHTEDDNARFMQVFALMSVLTTVLVFVFLPSEYLYELYLLPVIVWLLPALGKADLMAQDAPPVLSRDTLVALDTPRFSIHKLLASGMCLVLMVSGLLHADLFLHPDTTTFTYSGLNYTETGTVRRLTGVADYVDSNGYTLGYASYWNANVITELTDGKVKMNSITFGGDRDISFHNWLTDLSLHDEAYVAGQKVFVLMTLEEKMGFFDNLPELTENSHEVLSLSDYFVVELDDPTILVKYINGDLEPVYEEDEW